MKSVLKNSTLPPLQQAVSLRLREERKLEGFSQEELASDAKLKRASLSHYEYGITALPFGAGIKLCRRLDLNQQWLATGREPRRPYVPLTDLHVDPKVVVLYDGTFLDGYRELLAVPMRAWLKKHPIEKLVEMQLHGGMEKYFARKTSTELEQLIREYSAILRELTSAGQKLGALSHIQMAAAEMQRRLEHGFAEW